MGGGEKPPLGRAWVHGLGTEPVDAPTLVFNDTAPCDVRRQDPCHACSQVLLETCILMYSY